MIKYITISEDLLLNRSLNLNLTEKLVLAIIGILTKKGEVASTVSDEYFSAITGKNKCYMNRSIAKLKKLGLIDVYREFSRRNIRLTLSPSNKGLVYNFGIDKRFKKVDN